MSSVEASGSRNATGLARLALVIAVLLIVVLGLMLPGAGLVLALGIGYTAYRDDRRLRRRLLLLGLVVTVVAIVLAVLVSTGSTEIVPSPPIAVTPD